MKGVVLFGAGSFLLRNIQYIREHLEIVAVCDNDVRKQGTLFDDTFQIISVEELKNNYTDCEVLISLENRKNADAAGEQLRAEGILYKHVNDALFKVCQEKGERFCMSDENRKEMERLYTSRQNIIVITAPTHGNLGDQAQSYCTECLFRDHYKDSNIIIYDDWEANANYYELLYIIKQSLKPEDKILVHSGFHLTDMFMPLENLIEEMGRLFWDKGMIFLPQTVRFDDKTIKMRMVKSINKNVTIMCRDEVSYQLACEMFSGAKIKLYPDVVTSLIGRFDFQQPRKGILFSNRGEDFGDLLFSDDEIDELINQLKKKSPISLTDTSITYINYKKIAANRKYYIEREIARYAQYELVITNRFHGIIFALAANTPVIAIPLKDHKITSGIKWYEDAEFDGVYLCDNVDDIVSTAEKIISNPPKLCHSDYFYKKYYEKFDLNNL